MEESFMTKLILILLLLLPFGAFAQTARDLKLFSGADSRFVINLDANYADAIEKLKSENLSGVCQDRQQELNRLKRADLEQRNLLADQSIAENLDPDNDPQKIYRYIALPSLDIELAELNFKICRIHQSPTTEDSRESGRRSQKLYCYRDAQLQIHRTKVEWDMIDGRHSDLPEQAFIEKMRVYTNNVPAQFCE
jgi:hypothetical protein